MLENIVFNLDCYDNLFTVFVKYFFLPVKDRFFFQEKKINIELSVCLKCVDNRKNYTLAARLMHKLS